MRQVARLMGEIRTTEKVSVASPNWGRGADRSVVLIGPLLQSHFSVPGQWRQALKVWGRDHRLRAEVYAALINQAAQEKRDALRHPAQLLDPVADHR